MMQWAVEKVFRPAIQWTGTNRLELYAFLQAYNDAYLYQHYYVSADRLLRSESFDFDYEEIVVVGTWLVARESDADWDWDIDLVADADFRREYFLFDVNLPTPNGPNPTDDLPVVRIPREQAHPSEKQLREQRRASQHHKRTDN